MPLFLLAFFLLQCAVLSFVCPYLKFPRSCGSSVTPTLTSVAVISVPMTTIEPQRYSFEDCGYADGGLFCSLDDLHASADAG
jgi:hypothetical protein